MPSFVSRVNNFFSFRESFSRRPSVVFSRREERLCSPLLSKSTTFFRSVKLFVPPWSQSFFFNREERLCSPSLSKSTTFFHFLKLSFHREAKSFSSIARSGYAPPRTTSQPLFCILANFAATQCVDPVAREMHSKQTPPPCQHKNHFCTNIQANPPPKANFREISILPQPYPHPTTTIAHPPARPHRRSMRNTPALLDQSSHGTQQGHPPPQTCHSIVCPFL